MKIQPLSLAVIAICLFTTLTTTAQVDSASFDLGYTSVDKKFTQYITVKGEDLQKLPFSTIEEAIGVYFGGIYTTRKGTTYIIDGNISPTVDALSIYDIASITLIQNAQTILNGALPSQQLILITTKSGLARSSGITAAVSGYITKRRNTGTEKFYPQKSPTFYQQYNISGNFVNRRSEFGASVDFLRESFVMPGTSLTISSTPRALNRFRGNAWFNTGLGKKSVLTLRIGVSPQDSSFEYQYQILSGHESESRTKGSNISVYPSVRLFTHFSKGWSNDLNVSYIHLHEDVDNDIVFTSNAQFPVTDEMEENGMKQSQFLIRNRVGVEKKCSNWTFNPALNFLFTSKKTSTDYLNQRTSDGQTISLSNAFRQINDREFALTPTISMAYKEVFSIQAGAQYNLFKKEFLSQTVGKIFPFISATLDVARVVRPSSRNALMIFASYAKGNSWKERMYHNEYGYPYYGNQDNSVFMPYPPMDPSTSLFLGTTFRLPENKFQFSYTFRKNKYFEFVPAGLSGNQMFFQNSEMKLSNHQFSMNYHSLAYNTSISAFYQHSSSGVPIIAAPVGGNGYIGGASNYTKLLLTGWSGGWANSFRINRFTAGINAMYFFNKEINSLLLQYLYIGYNTSIHQHSTELYASARNLLQNKKAAILTGDIAYFGLGIKTNL